MFRLTNCVDCVTIDNLLNQIDCKITDLAKIQYNNTLYALNLQLDPIVIDDLLTYKRILTKKACNADYASCYSVEEIAGKVKILIYK